MTERLDANYQELIDLGFQRFDYPDSVFFKQCGRHPFLLFYDLDKRYRMETGCDFKEATLFRSSAKPWDSNFKRIKVLSTMEQVLFVMEVFGHHLNSDQS